MSDSFQISPHVVFENFDDEVVAIHMESGTYFSLDSRALEVWELLRQGTSVADIVSALKARYEAPEGAIETALDELLTDLQSEGLVLPATETPGVKPEIPLFGGEKTAFIKPSFAKFTDMQDLLLLDPIHEVDETGWPSAKIA